MGSWLIRNGARLGTRHMPVMPKPLFTLVLLFWSLISAQEEFFYYPTPLTQAFGGCSPNDSCRWDGRSNESLLNPSDMSTDVFRKTQCFCDPDCWQYRDCCRDADPTRAHTRFDTRWRCDLLPGADDDEHIYVIGTCPPDWSDRHEANLCERRVFENEPYSYLLDVPVFSNRTRKAYANMYCAKCNQDVQLVPLSFRLKCPLNLQPQYSNCSELVRLGSYVPGRHKWIVHPDEKQNIYRTVIELVVNKFQNMTYLQNKYRPRRCRPVVDKCPEQKSEYSQNCTMFASYVVIHEQETYKNVYCAQCNGVNSSFMKCASAKTTTTTMYTQHYPYRPSAKDSFTFSYSWLIDFHDPMGTTEVGLQFRCMDGEIFDPIYSICMPFMCGKQFIKVKGECVRREAADDAHNHRNCRMLPVKKTEVTLLERNAIYVNKTKKTYESGDFEEHDNDSYLVCQSSDSYIEKFSAVQSRLSIASMTVSLTCLAAHIIIHLSIAKLRNLPGKNLLNLCIALFLAQILFISAVNNAVAYPGLCVTVAIITHFCFLATFFWMNVMALDIYRTFTSPNYRPHVGKQNKTFCRYAAYAWFVPIVIVATAITFDYTNILPTVRPSYGKHICWLSHRRGLLVFFALPLAVLLLANTIYFVLTAYGIHVTTQVTRTIVRKTSDKIRFYLYVKLAFIMGLTWALGFVAAVVEFEPLWYMFIVFNASQGAFIFVAFTLKRKVLRLACERLTGKTPSILTGGSTSSSKPSSRRTSSIKTSSIREYPAPSSENLVRQ